MRERVARFSAHYVALHNAGVKRKGSIPLADLVTRTMLPRSPDAEAFWRDFRRHAGIDHDNYVAVHLVIVRRWRLNLPIWSSP